MTTRTTTLTATDGRTFSAEVVSQSDASKISDYRCEPGFVLIVTSEGFCIAAGDDLADAIEQFDEHKVIPKDDGPDGVLSLDDMTFYLVGDDVEDAAERVRSAKSLASLKDALNELDEACQENDRRSDQHVDMTNLKTFGGPDPDSTDQVWSWDEEHLLVSDNAGGFELRRRDDLAA